jgi:hypothetical protein
VYKKRLKDENHYTVFNPQEGYIGKLDRRNDRKTCGKPPANITAEIPIPPTYLPADCLE